MEELGTALFDESIEADDVYARFVPEPVSSLIEVMTVDIALGSYQVDALFGRQVPEMSLPKEVR